MIDNVRAKGTADLSFGSFVLVEGSAALEESVVQFLVAERLPFRLVESPFFLRMLRAARPDGRPVTLKSRFTYSRRVDTVYESAVAATKEELASAAGRLHLVLDLWSERHSKVG